MKLLRFDRSHTLRHLAVPAALLFGSAAAATTAVKPGARALVDDATAVHVLNRMAFGPTPGEIARLKAVGVDRYVDAQLRPDRRPDADVDRRVAQLTTLPLSSRDIATRYYVPAMEMRRSLREDAARSDRMTEAGSAAPSGQPGAATASQLRRADLTADGPRQMTDARRRAQLVLSELGQQKLLRAVYSERQLQEVLVDFWFNHFNVFAGKGLVQAYLTEYERDAIRPHVLGRFRDLLGAVAHSPAMLFYLDNWQSSDPETNTRGAPGRARARRERSSGSMAWPPETGAAPVPQRAPRGLNENYARELLELHTLGVDAGYDQHDVTEVARAFTGWTIRTPRQGGGFWFDERRHARGAKTVLGQTIDKGGERDGEAVLDLVAGQVSTATFIATKLARRFVADEPPAALVERAADKFRQTRGDLREVVRTILTAPELISNDARRAKVKTPFEFVASALRVSRAEVSDAAPLLRQLRELGMPLYYAQPPTGYADRADAWVNTGALLARMNFALALVGGRIPGVRADLAAFAGNGSVEAIRAHLLDAVLTGAASESTRQTLDRGRDVAQVAALALGSPEFQRR